jgi:hypothetical protein
LTTWGADNFGGMDQDLDRNTGNDVSVAPPKDKEGTEKESQCGL